VLLFTLAAHAVFTLPGGPDSRTAYPRSPTWDEGTVLYGALRVAQGEVLYRDFFEFQGPVFFWLFSWLFGWLGPSMPAAQALQVLLNASSALGLAVVVARLAGPVIALTSSVLFVCLIVPMWPHAYPHWLALLFVHAALALLAGARPAWWRLGLAGACLGLSMATIQSLGVAAFGASVVGVLVSGAGARRWRAGVMAALPLVAGALSVVGVIAALFAAHGALGDLAWAMFEWPFQHYRGINSTSYAAFLVDHLDSNRSQPHLWRLLSQAGVVVIAALPLLAMLFGGAVIVAQGRALLRRAAPIAGVVPAIVAVAVVLPLFVAHTRSDVVHLAFLSSLAFVAMAAAVSHWPALGRRLGLALSVLAGVFALNFSWKTYRSTTHPDRPISFKQAWEKRFTFAEALEAAVKPGDRVVVGPEGSGGYAYLFTGTVNATSYTYLPFGWRAESDYLSSAQWDRAGREIVERRPVVIVVDDEQWARLLRSAPALSSMYEQRDELRHLRPAPSPGVP